MCKPPRSLSKVWEPNLLNLIICIVEFIVTRPQRKIFINVYVSFYFNKYFAKIIGWQFITKISFDQAKIVSCFSHCVCELTKWN